MLVLLIIFIVITPMLSKGITVEMVKTKNPIHDAGGRQRRRRAGCGQPRRHRPTWARTRWLRTSLPAKVKDLLTNKLDKTVYMRATRARVTSGWWRWSIICAPPAWISLVC